MTNAAVQSAYDLALLMTGSLSTTEQAQLALFCEAAYATYVRKLKPEQDPVDCEDALVNATAMLALASLADAGDLKGLEQFTAGEISIKLQSGSKSAASDCLRTQAQLLMSPYLQYPMSFMGV